MDCRKTSNRSVANCGMSFVRMRKYISVAFSEKVLRIDLNCSIVTSSRITSAEATLSSSNSCKNLSQHPFSDFSNSMSILLLQEVVQEAIVVSA